MLMRYGDAFVQLYLHRNQFDWAKKPFLREDNGKMFLGMRRRWGFSFTPESQIASRPERILFL